MKWYFEIKGLFKRIFFSIFIIFSLGIILFSSIENIGSNDKIWLEVESPTEISHGLKIFEDTEASGGKGIASQLPSHHTEAFASYSFKVLNSGSYHTWLRAYWPGACNNAFILKMDGDPKSVLIGNDNTLNIWHWIPGPTFELKSGNHILHIWNDEYDSRLDKILFTPNPYYKPQGKDESFDFFTDFEEELPQLIHTNNPDLWKIVKNKTRDNSFFFLNGNKQNLPEYSFIDIINNKKFFFSCDVKKENVSGDSEVQFLFNYLDNKNYYKAELIKNNLNITIKKHGRETNIGHFEGNQLFIDTVFNKFSIIYHYPTMVFKYNGKTLISLSDNNFIEGKVAFGSINKNICFDNMENTVNLTPLYQEHFFMTWIEGESQIKLQPYLGNWAFGQFGIMSLEAKALDSNEAFAILGKEYWQDYIFTAAVKTYNDAGLCFYVQDEHNYFMYKMITNFNNTGNLQLLKIENSKSLLLCDRKCLLKRGEWYKMGVNIKNDSISLLLDNNNVLNYIDNTYVDGKIGFWCNSSKYKSLFDDIVISPIKITNHISNKLKYEFEIREKAGLDFCDWKNSGNVFKRKNYDGWSDQIVVEKPLFSEVSIWNKKLFSGKVKIKVNYRAIPKDIDANIIFKAMNNARIDEYKFTTSEDRVLITKNNNTLFRKKIIFDRNQCSIEYKDHEWFFKSKDMVLFRYQEKNDHLLIQIGLSYNGIGMGDISINGISISSDMTGN